MRALIVDDEADIAGLLELGLREAGFETESASDGETALRLLLAHPPDVVLLDRMLPGLSGDELCRAIKRDARTRHVPVVLVTARASEKDRISGLELGADDYVTKPFFLRELVLRCRALARAPLPPARAPAEPLPSWACDLGLTAGEEALLGELWRGRGRVCPVQGLLQSLPASSRRGGSRPLHARLRKLRRKLSAAGVRLELLRGVGYRLAAPTAPSS